MPLFESFVKFVQNWKKYMEKKQIYHFFSEHGVDTTVRTWWEGDCILHYIVVYTRF